MKHFFSNDTSSSMRHLQTAFPWSRDFFKARYFQRVSSNLALFGTRSLQHSVFINSSSMALLSKGASWKRFRQRAFFKLSLPKNAPFSKTSSSPARVFIVSSTFLFSSLLHCSVQSKNTGFLQTRLASNAPSQLLEEAKPFLLSSRSKAFQSTKSLRPCKFLFVQHQRRNC
jgi:hypothetical protein